jgi:protein BCP1
MFVLQEIVIEFEAFAPEESDFQGIKKLLHQLFLKEDVNTSELANLLISTPDVTTILKQVDDDDDDDEDESDEDDVYGVFSLIDLKSNTKSAPGIESLRRLLTDKAGSSDQDKKFADAARQALSGKSSLILNERFINLPARISLPCFQSLVQDLKSKPDLDFDHFFLIIKVQKAIGSKKKSSQKNGSKRQKVDGSGSSSSGSGDHQAVGDDASGILFQNPEDEILCDSAVQWMEFSVANQCDEDVRSGNWDEEDVKYRPHRRILLLDRQRFLTAVSHMQHELSEPTS